MRRIKTLGLALFLSLSLLPAALSAKEHRNTYNNAWSADEREGRDRDRDHDGGYYNQREFRRNSGYYWGDRDRDRGYYDQRELHRNNGYYRGDRDDEDYYRRNWNREDCYRGGW
jgi:hypothetical protein